LLGSLIETMGISGVSLFLAFTTWAGFLEKSIHKGLPITGVVLSIFIFLIAGIMDMFEKEEIKIATIVAKVSTVVVFLSTVVMSYFFLNSKVHIESNSSFIWVVVVFVLLQSITLTFKVGMIKQGKGEKQG